VVNVAAPNVSVEAPAVTVEPAVINVAPAEVRVMNEQHDTEQLVETDPFGNVKRVLTRRVRA
jgi:hypothetical protein